MDAPGGYGRPSGGRVSQGGGAPSKSPSSKSAWQALRRLDAYPKARRIALRCRSTRSRAARRQINEDFFTRTASGGVVTLVASVFMILLFLSELRACIRFAALPRRR